MRAVLVLTSWALCLAGCVSGGDTRDAAPRGDPVARDAATRGDQAARAREARRAEAVDLLAKGRALEDAGGAAAAADLYREGLVLAGSSADQRSELHLRIAQIEQEAGRAETALEHAREARRLRPSSEDARKLVARLEQDAAKAKEQGAKSAKDGRRAKRGTASGRATDTPARDDEDDELRRSVAELQDAVRSLAADRDALTVRVRELEREAAALRAAAEELRAARPGAR